MELCPTKTLEWLQQIRDAGPNNCSVSTRFLAGLMQGRTCQLERFDDVSQCAPCDGGGVDSATLGLVVVLLLSCSLSWLLIVIQHRSTEEWRRLVGGELNTLYTGLRAACDLITFLRADLAQGKVGGRGTLVAQAGAAVPAGGGLGGLFGGLSGPLSAGGDGTMKVKRVLHPKREVDDGADDAGGAASRFLDLGSTPNVNEKM